jgi:dihydrodipicolinate synthase/N-acetylneuraminate lyase
LGTIGRLSLKQTDTFRNQRGQILISWLTNLRAGTVIPAHPLALNAQRKLDERRQRALTRYYLAAGAKGVAVGVHTTQFEIHNPSTGLLRPVLELAIAECKSPGLIKIAGVCGETRQAVCEAEMAKSIGYDLGLLSLADLSEATVDELIAHVTTIADILPVMGFYLQPAVKGRALPYEFWRRMVEIQNVVAIKVAPFNRYRTLDVIRAVLDSGRAHDIALYTGNDDNIIADLLTPFRFGNVETVFAGALLGQFANWTYKAVEILERIKVARTNGHRDALDLLALGQELTDANAAIFDFANGYRGCIPGIHEVLRRQGLLEGRWCLDPHEELSPGQNEEIDRVLRSYPHLADDEFVARHIDQWLD